MVYFAVISLVLGVFCGQWIFSAELIEFCSQIADIALYLLMFAVGISVGMNKNVFKKVKQYHIKIFIIPIGIIIASCGAGIIGAWLLKEPLRDGLCIASGLGWYSLSGVLLTDLIGAKVGAVAFLSNLLREILSFFSIPFIAKHFNYYTAIAPAGATSEDTTLPMMIKYTSEDVVVISVFNGVICSAAVPLLIKFFFQIFGES